MRFKTPFVVWFMVALLAAAGCGRSGDSAASRQGRTVIQNKGSDSMVIVVLVWAERYNAIRPDAGIVVGGGGTGAGISGLINGNVDVANATRRPTETERRQAVGSGFEIFETTVGYDAPAFVVHEDNPISSFTLGQLAEIYGQDGTIESWDQLGIEVPGCRSGEIVRVSRQSSSGTNEYLRRAILGRTGEYKLGTRDMQGSKDVVALVAGTPCAVGYTGMAYAPPARVRTPCIQADEHSTCVTPSMQSAVDGSYPISRPLLMVTAGRPTGEVRQFLDWVVSEEGQCIVQEVGYAPMRPVHCGEG
jgi:phosphate transport system substrate-binding protein